MSSSMIGAYAMFVEIRTPSSVISWIQEALSAPVSTFWPGRASERRAFDDRLEGEHARLDDLRAMRRVDLDAPLAALVAEPHQRATTRRATIGVPSGAVGSIDLTRTVFEFHSSSSPSCAASPYVAAAKSSVGASDSTSPRAAYAFGVPDTCTAAPAIV
jgi:hypothetical protein